MCERLQRLLHPTFGLCEICCVGFRPALGYSHDPGCHVFGSFCTAILVPPVHDGGLGSQIVFSRSRPHPRRLSHFWLSSDPNVTDGAAASNIGGDA